MEHIKHIIEIILSILDNTKLLLTINLSCLVVSFSEKLRLEKLLRPLTDDYNTIAIIFLIISTCALIAKLILFLISKALIHRKHRMQLQKLKAPNEMYLEELCIISLFVENKNRVIHLRECDQNVNELERFGWIKVCSCEYLGFGMTGYALTELAEEKLKKINFNAIYNDSLSSQKNYDYANKYKNEIRKPPQGVY